ncbi:MAG: N-acetyltransferase family protein [Bacteroidales bacterium]
MMIREMTDMDSFRVLDIYRMGLETGNATFETSVPTWMDWDLKHLKHSRFVYIENNNILGWVSLSPVSTRKVYEGVAEVSIYIDINNLGRGIGSKLMGKVIESSEKHGIWTLYSSVFPEITATLKLHHKFGFRTIGVREKIARLDGKWRDTVLLERRSKIVGL